MRVPFFGTTAPVATIALSPIESAGQDNSVGANGNVVTDVNLIVGQASALDHMWHQQRVLANRPESGSTISIKGGVPRMIPALNVFGPSRAPNAR